MVPQIRAARVNGDLKHLFIYTSFFPCMPYNPELLIDSIAMDNVHGADYLSNKAIEVLVTVSLHEDAPCVDVLHELLWSIGIRLVSSRPSMAPLANKIGYLFNELEKTTDLNSYRSRLRKLASNLVRRSEKSKKRIAEYLETVAVDAETVFTYSYSSTVIDVIRENRYENILVTESRPTLEGKLLAEKLGEEGFNVLLVIDAAAGVYVPNADICIIGADSVQYDGSVVNKVGSSLLGYAALDHNIPFYVLCDTSKFNVLNYLGKTIEPEMKPPDEVAEPMLNVTIGNPYFEVVPPRLITGVITEKGLMEPLDIRTNMEFMRRYVEPFITVNSR
ncbi:hypothetical protein GF326_03525 [Candidatus Bathyarchaeota archaeon]|nr:hypothetical protein [Candidatus Bathyarchaeota archaeon]